MIEQLLGDTLIYRLFLVAIVFLLGTEDETKFCSHSDVIPPCMDERLEMMMHKLPVNI